MATQKKTLKRKPLNPLDQITNRATVWIGSTASIVIHTVIFLVSFLLVRFGISLDSVLLTLTTVVSLEAIYLAIFIQRSVNLQSQTLATEFDELEEAISEDIDETEAALMKDLDDTEKQISDDIDESEAEISKDIDETERGIVKKTPKALEKPFDAIIEELRGVIREEIKEALRQK
jgi:low affinity Fe/Cu permease